MYVGDSGPRERREWCGGGARERREWLERKHKSVFGPSRALKKPLAILKVRVVVTLRSKEIVLHRGYSLERKRNELKKEEARKSVKQDQSAERKAPIEANKLVKMTTEPFRYDQQVLDVSEMNMTSGLRNSLIPSSASVRLGLSSDLLSSHDILGRSADGVTLATGSDSAFSSAPMLMAGHHKAMNHSQLAPPLSSSLFAAGLPSMSSANVSAALSSLSSNGQANPNLNPPLPDHNASAAANGAYLPNGARNPPTSNGSSSTRDAGPTPIIQIPSSLQSSGPTLSEAMAMGVDAESLQRAMQNAPHNSGPFNMAHYLQQHRAATSSPSASQSSQQQSTPVITSSGQLRYSGDRFASSAFSPVSPGGTSTASKISSIAYSSTSGGQTPTPGSVIPPLAQMTAHMSPLQFASPSGQSASSPMQNMGGHMVQSPYTPASMGSMNPQTPSSYGSYDPMGSRSGTDMHSNGMSNSNMGSPSMMNGMNGGDAMSPYSTMTPGGPNSQSSISTPHVTTPGGTVLAVGPPPHKRPYLGPNSNDPQLYRPMHPGSGPSSDASDDSSRTAQGMMMMMPGTPGVNSGMGTFFDSAL